jgi:hypothetical protein
VKMKLGLLGVLTLVLLVGITAAMATGREDLSRPAFPTGQLGDMYDRADIWSGTVGQAVDLPAPLPENGPGQALAGGETNSLNAAHNTAVGSNTLSPLASRTFTNQVGRSVALPKNQVDRQISKLIKRFD